MTFYDTISRGLKSDRRDFAYDVHIASFPGVDTGSGIDRVLVLEGKRNIVELIGSHLIAAKIVQVQYVRLSRLTSDDTHTFHIGARKGAGREQFERSSTQV